MPEKPNCLGEFLRARRELVTPEQVGITDLGGRRVAGLRREEVAVFAGISVEYYLRLERGIDRNPSVQVLESIARVLQLKDDQVSYLLSLAGDDHRQTRRQVRRETVPDSTLTLLSTLPYPAFVEGRYFDVLAANPLAAALSPRLSVGSNQLLDVFLDPAEQSLHLDLDAIRTCYVAGLRQLLGPDSSDQRLIELVGRLSVASPSFRDLWHRHDVGVQRSASVPFDHPQVGEMTLEREPLAISGTDRMTLVIFHAQSGSAAAEKLALLASSVLQPASGSGPDRRAPILSRAPILRPAADVLD